MSVIFSHPTGNANVRAAVHGLLQNQSLSAFHTAIASFPGSFLDRLGNIPFLSEIRRRRFDNALKPFTHTSPWHEAGRIVAAKARLEKLTKHESGIFCVDAVYRNIDKKVASKLKGASKQGVKAVYAYEDEALFSFREAKKWRIKCLYDLPIGYWRTAKHLLQQEMERWPEWGSTLPSFIDSEDKLCRKDEELHLANHIFVASRFTANTLKDFPGKLAPIEVIPYGFPAADETRKYSPNYNSPLKLLFVGGLSQRKGIADVFAVAEKLGRHVELTVVGQRASEDCKALDTALAKHCWIPSLPHADILKLMRESDVLLFPSLFEGFGLVITEAMSQGTPVITTDRTAGPDLIEHGRNGWLVEAGSTPALLNAVENLLQQPQRISGAGRAAMETARLRPWKAYGQELADAIKKQL